LEAVIVVGLAFIVSLLNSDRPFCEACRQWTHQQLGVARLWGNGSEPAWEKVLAGELPALAEFPPAPPGSSQYVRLDLARCPVCADSRFLSISSVTVSINKDGKVSENTRSLVTNAVLTPSQCAVVEVCGQLYEQSLEASLAEPDVSEASPEETPDESAEAGGQSAPTEGEPR
jgi:hypothetical protein